VLTIVVSLLAEDTPLPERNRDHALGGDWSDHRQRHLKPDLLLIDRKPDTEVPQLVRLGFDKRAFCLTAITTITITTIPRAFPPPSLK
jgi:addiction module RelE/StbE family toxin